LTDKNPTKSIIKKLLSLVENDTNLSYFNDCLSVLDLIDHIQHSQRKDFDSYDATLDLILANYRNKAIMLMKTLHEHTPQLDHFYSVYKRHYKIKAIRESNAKTLNPFSHRHHLKETIASLDKLLSRYQKLVTIAKESQIQKDYSELLIKVLEGEQQEPIIHLGQAQKTQGKTSSSLLPETEFPVPQAEPEHPDYIGINRTMNFNPAAEQKSVFVLFSANELKNDFHEAFGWAIDTQNIDKLEKAKYDPNLNLLATDEYLPPDLQMAVISYVLLSLDILGKVSGIEGELSVVNFTTIKSVTDGLQHMSSQLTMIPFDENAFTLQLGAMMENLQDLNQELIMLSQTQETSIPIQNNPNLNEYCHLNEHLCHLLLGVPYDKSVLTPLDPHSSLLNQMSTQLRQDFLQHSASGEISH
jgi:hypothetical protein